MKLPVHRFQRGVSGQSTGNRMTPNVAQSKGLQMIGGAVTDLGVALAKTEDSWAKAKTTNQYTVARNSRKSSIADIMARAEAEVDYNNSEAYFKELNEVASAEVEIGSDSVKEIYDSETQLDKDMNEIRLNSLFRGKMVKFQRGEIQADGQMSEESFTRIGETEIGRANILKDYKTRLKVNKDTGIISNQEYLGELEDTKSWEMNRAMKIAGTYPQDVIDNPNRFNVSESEKRELLTAARNTIVRFDQIAKLDTLSNQNTNEAVFNKQIFTDKETSVAEKILFINKMELEGNFSATYATTARRYLNSTTAANATTSSAAISKVIRLMNDANVGFEEGGRNKDEEYLNNIRAIQGEILSTKDLSEADRVSLQNRLDNSTQKKLSEATHEIGKYGDKVYKDADTFFKDAVPSHLQDEALRTFFYRTTGQEMSETQAKAEMQKIAIETISGKREVVQDAFDKARVEEGRNADLRMVRTKKGGQAIVLYKDGKPVRVVSTVEGGK